MSHDDDRIVHVRYFDSEIVRYDLAGKWYLETPGKVRKQLKLADAVVMASKWATKGAEIHLDRQGGALFASKLKVALKAKGLLEAVEARQ